MERPSTQRRRRGEALTARRAGRAVGLVETEVEDEAETTQAETAGSPASHLPAAQVIAVGFRPGPLLAGRVQAHTVDHIEEGRLQRLLDAASEDIEAFGAVVALYPAWDRSGIGHELETVRSLLQTVRLVACPLAGSPLAGAVVASLAAQMATTIDSAGHLVALVPVFEANVHTLAWLGSVRGLAHPSPSMTQHLASFWPATSFAVASWLLPSLHRASAGEAIFPPVEGPRGLALAARPGEGDLWLRRAIRGQGPLVEMDVSHLPPEYWGTERVAEAVAFPIDPERLAQAAGIGLRLRSCPWCGEAVLRRVCPFCRMALDEAKLAAAV